MRGNFVDLWHGNILFEDKQAEDINSDRLLNLNEWSFLNDGEKQKALSFARPDLQYKYIKTRAELKKILATYLKLDAQQVVIQIGEYGKPFVAETPVFFNLSHTGDQLLIAVSNTGEIGVDIEKIKDRKNLHGLAGKCFSEQECAYWHSLSEQQKQTMFYHFWVAKEAFVKAVGRGLALGLNLCVVNPAQPTGFLSLPAGCGEPEDWKITGIKIDQHHASAVVTVNTEFTLNQIEIQ